MAWNKLACVLKERNTKFGVGVVADTHNFTHIDSGYIGIEYIRSHITRFYGKFDAMIKRGNKLL